MISKTQSKADIDTLDDRHLEALHRILAALKAPPPDRLGSVAFQANPLKGSVRFETDLRSPIDEPWAAER